MVDTANYKLYVLNIIDHQQSDMSQESVAQQQPVGSEVTFMGQCACVHTRHVAVWMVGYIPHVQCMQLLAPSFTLYMNHQTQAMNIGDS